MIVSVFMVSPLTTHAQSNPLRILFIGAHPDDCDIKGGGTAALFAAQGHQVKFIAVTNGDAGHMETGGCSPNDALQKRRNPRVDWASPSTK